MLFNSKSFFCWLLGHLYLPAQKVVSHYSGDMREVDYLLCPRCDHPYYFAFHEYWHRESDRREYLRAQARQTAVFRRGNNKKEK